MRQFLTMFAVTLVFAVCAARGEEQPRVINTSGESTVYVAPDEVVVNLGIETFDPNLEEAKSANDQAASKLLTAIKQLGIQDKHIQTAQLEIQIVYANGKHLQKIEGYLTRRSYAVTLKEPKNFEKLVSVALRNGANQLLGFQFRNTELRKYRDQARKMAIKAAREKAADLSGELGCKVGSPRTITEGAFGYFGYTSGYWGSGNSYMTQNSIQSVGGAGEGGDNLPLGQIAIRATVSVTFDLVP